VTRKASAIDVTRCCIDAASLSLIRPILAGPVTD
jgi:hypothetical protein